jgi:hypothetical protein
LRSIAAPVQLLRIGLLSTALPAFLAIIATVGFPQVVGMLESYGAPTGNPVTHNRDVPIYAAYHDEQIKATMPAGTDRQMFIAVMTGAKTPKKSDSDND